MGSGLLLQNIDEKPGTKRIIILPSQTEKIWVDYDYEGKCEPNVMFWKNDYSKLCTELQDENDQIKLISGSLCTVT